MNDCGRQIELISLYVDGMLAEPDKAGLESHMAECPVCAGRLRDFRKITREAEAMDAVPPVQLHSVIMNAVHREAIDARRQAPAFYVKYSRHIAAAAILVLLVSSVFGNLNRLYLFGGPGKYAEAAPMQASGEQEIALYRSAAVSDSAGFTEDSGTFSGAPADPESPAADGSGDEVGSKQIITKAGSARAPNEEAPDYSPENTPPDGLATLMEPQGGDTASPPTPAPGGTAAASGGSGTPSSPAAPEIDAPAAPPANEALSPEGSASGEPAGADTPGANGIPQAPGSVSGQETGESPGFTLPYNRKFAFLLVAQPSENSVLPAYFDDFKQEAFTDTDPPMRCIFLHNIPELVQDALIAFADAGYQVSIPEAGDWQDTSQKTGLVIVLE